MKSSLLTLLAVTLLATPALAAEVEAVDSAKVATEFALGARIGGYGFRGVDPEKDPNLVEGAVNWETCRMNGVGLFGTIDIARYFFGELSADLYHSIGNSWNMDRISFFPAAAVGARLLPGKLVSPYIQAGGGPEFTRIGLGGVTERKVLASGFMGIGGELNIKRFHFGAVLKFFSMGLPEYDEKSPESYYYPNNTNDPGEGNRIVMRHEIASQAQFFARYTF